jgi:hypothetical protein
MPYNSEAQRRFFHSEGAEKAGITPAMVKEWDEASKGKKRPEKVEKQAQAVALLLGKLAAAAAMSSTKITGFQTPNPGVKPRSQNGQPGQPQDAEDYKPGFIGNSAAAAQRGTDDRLGAGHNLTMPS